MARMVPADAALGREVALKNGTDSAQMLTLTTFGVPQVPGPAEGTGFSIKRDFYAMDGTPADVSRVAQGTRLVAVLTVTPFRDAGSRLMVDDPLPAGFEIDNPDLLRSGDIGALDWLTMDAQPQATQFLSDRFAAAVDWRSARPFRLAYILRAVTPGSYHQPAASVEDMYRPQYRAKGETGTVTVTP